jgi:hypothetical protein
MLRNRYPRPAITWQGRRHRVPARAGSWNALRGLTLDAPGNGDVVRGRTPIGPEVNSGCRLQAARLQLRAHY